MDKDVKAYLDGIENEDKKVAVTKLIEIFSEKLPDGFELRMQYDMPCFVVPFEKYPNGYHVDPTNPLGYVAFAAQKSHVAVYHSGVYMDPKTHDWFVEAYPKHMSTKLNMGKSCIRFTNAKKIPYELMSELAEKNTVDDAIEMYERAKLRK